MSESVVSLDPISSRRKVQDGLISRFFKTHRFGGKRVKRTDPIGHYMFVGPQRSSKTTSAVFFMEWLIKKYNRKGKTVAVYSNLGFGGDLTKLTLHELICNIDYDPDLVYIFLIDEIQSYFPKDTKNKDVLYLIDQLTGDFSQVAKKNIYILSTAQVYGRCNKNLREQVLYMVDCHLSFFNKCVNDFIKADDIICDELGRWAGIPDYIWVHGLPKTNFNTHRMIMR